MVRRKLSKLHAEQSRRLLERSPLYFYQDNKNALDVGSMLFIIYSQYFVVGYLLEQVVAKQANQNKG
jgi:hypothetical protein